MSEYDEFWEWLHSSKFKYDVTHDVMTETEHGREFVVGVYFILYEENEDDE